MRLGLFWSDSLDDHYDGLWIDFGEGIDAFGVGVELQSGIGLRKDWGSISGYKKSPPGKQVGLNVKFSKA